MSDLGKRYVTKEEGAIKAASFSTLSNIFLAIIKWVAGLLGNSFALIADAIESTTDILVSFLVLLGLRYSTRPADKNHPYGHGRIEALVTFLVVGFLILSATIIAYQSIHNIRTPHESPKAFTLYVLAAIILWKEASYRIVIRKSKETHSTSLRADAWHHRSDAMTSVAAFVGISVALILGEGYEAADDWAALFASGIILYNCYLIFRPALGEIMDENSYENLTASIRNVSKKVEGVIDTEKCLIRKNGMKYQVDLHVIVDAEISVRKGHEIAHNLQNRLRLEIPELGNILIHVEPDR